MIEMRPIEGFENDERIIKIQRYISRTRFANKSNYKLTGKQMRAFYELSRKLPWESLILIYEFGLARGYHAAQNRRKSI